LKRVFLFSAFIFIGFPVYSQQSLNDALKSASQITNSTERLNAYDTILEKYGIKSSVGISDTDIGKWSSSIRTDPITDSKIITFLLRASSGSSSYGDPVYLIIRWNEGEVVMYIDWDSYLGSSIKVTFRVGDNTPETKTWAISTDSEASFYPDDTVSLMQSLLNVDRVIARCTPYGESPITAVFDITGFKALVTQYNDDLKWL
jgi:type VI secretion system protein VasI